MSNRIHIALAAAVASGSLLAAPTAHAEDRRPCVSKAEFYGAADFGAFPSGSDGLPNRAPHAQLPEPLGRIDLEQRWDVRGRGVTVHHFRGTDGGVGTGLGRPHLHVKMYRYCERPLSEMQVYVGYNPVSGSVKWIMLWPQRKTEWILADREEALSATG